MGGFNGRSLNSLTHEQLAQRERVLAELLKKTEGRWDRKLIQMGLSNVKKTIGENHGTF